MPACDRVGPARPEDHVSIVEGNRAKFEQIDDDFWQAQLLVESVRRKIDFVRESVQEAANAEGGQLASSKASRALAAIRAARGQKGYGKLKEQAGRGSGVFSAGGGASGSSKSNPPTASDGAPMSRTADGNDSHAVAMASTSAGRDDDDFKGASDGGSVAVSGLLGLQVPRMTVNTRAECR